jgi:hypothetical protein
MIAISMLEPPQDDGSHGSPPPARSPHHRGRWPSWVAPLCEIVFWPSALILFFTQTATFAPGREDAAATVSVLSLVLTAVSGGLYLYARRRS